MRAKRENKEIPELVEKKLHEAYHQIGAGGKKTTTWSWKLAVAAAVVMLFTSVGTAYAMEGKFPVRQLFAKIWGSQTEQAAVKKVSGSVEVINEKSTFKQLSIKPVQTIVDRMGAYLVLEITGKDGFVLENDMVFSAYNLSYDDNDTGSYQDYVLKRENNVMYYAIRMISEEPVAPKSQPVLHVRTYGGMVCSEFYQDGSPSKTYIDQEDGISTIKGEYEADILCNQTEDMVSIPMGDGVTADVYPLEVYVNQDLFDQMGLTRLSEEYHKAHILLKSGKEVKAELVHGLQGKSTVLEIEEPVDIEQVAGIRILGNTYLAE